MKRLIFILIVAVSAAGLIFACARKDEVAKTPVKLYYADAEINRLLPYDDEIVDSDSEHMADAVLDKLTEGRDDNDKIRRLLPKDKKCVSVRVDGNIAYVDLSSRIADTLPQSRDIEKLLIYQITDSITSLKGIRFVKFTVDGKIHKNFMGYYDMRETYKFRYPE